jgi:uncharacterized membrane protein YfcA
MLAHHKRGGVDYRMGGVLVAGGILGTGIGALLFSLLQALGQIDTVINLLYVSMLGGIGAMMARESIQTLRAGAEGRARCAAAGITRWWRDCRGVGGFIGRVFIFRRWRRCCWACSPAF